MKKKLTALLDGYGYYALVGICLLTVILTGVFTYRADQSRDLSTPSAADGAERLGNVAASPLPSATPSTAYLESAVCLRGYSDAPVFIEQSGLWLLHRATDFKLEKDAPVLAVMGGVVLSAQNSAVAVKSADGTRAEYSGLKTILVSPEQTVAPGTPIGAAGAAVPFEGEGHIHIAIYDQNNTPIRYFE